MEKAGDFSFKKNLKEKSKCFVKTLKTKKREKKGVLNTTERIQMKKEKIKKIVKKVKKVDLKRKNIFRLQGKHLFLTYPKIELTRESALEQLKEKILPRRIEKYVISTEKHSIGDEHLHVYLELDKVCDIESKNRLDLEIEGKENKHGNYQSCRSYNNVINYIIKGGKENVLTNMDLDDLGREKNV